MKLRSFSTFMSFFEVKLFWFLVNLFLTPEKYLIYTRHSLRTFSVSIAFVLTRTPEGIIIVSVVVTIPISYFIDKNLRLLAHEYLISKYTVKW